MAKSPVALLQSSPRGPSIHLVTVVTYDLWLWKESTLRKAHGRHHSPRRVWQSTEMNQAVKACSTSTGYPRHSPKEFLVG